MQDSKSMVDTHWNNDKPINIFFCYKSIVGIVVDEALPELMAPFQSWIYWFSMMASPSPSYIRCSNMCLGLSDAFYRVYSLFISLWHIFLNF